MNKSKNESQNTLQKLKENRDVYRNLETKRTRSKNRGTSLPAVCQEEERCKSRYISARGSSKSHIVYEKISYKL